MTPVRLEPAAPRSRVKHSTTEPLRSLKFVLNGTQGEGTFFLQFLYSHHIHASFLIPFNGNTMGNG